jgi:hypothetical protein
MKDIFFYRKEITVYGRWSNIKWLPKKGDNTFDF